MVKATVSKKIALRDIRNVGLADLRSEYERLTSEQFRLLSFYGQRLPGTSAVTLTLLMIDLSGTISAVRATAEQGATHYRSLLPEHPAFQIFEREILEQTGLEATGNTWLKPLRFPLGSPVRIADYPFFKIEGKEVHELGVGPVHAGVIEPGHFRFMCLGETVHHLEIQLGYQHRGVESLLLNQDPRRLGALVESITGDSSVTHAIAYSQALEDLAGVDCGAASMLIRSIALELERIAMHLASLGGIAGEIAYLPGASTYGRLRTAAINLSMRLSGSRFGRCWIRPGGVRYGISREQAQDAISTLTKLKDDAQVINDCMFSAKSVRHRLKGTGLLQRDEAEKIGLVGMAARACGLPIDLRLCSSSPDGNSGTRIADPESTAGDCFARALIRRDEMMQSLDRITGLLGANPEIPRDTLVPLPAFAASSLVVSAVEGWRGELIHCLETDEAGTVIHYRVQDPSLRNWLGAALAVRSNGISDFPVCNKSFDLSYCGNDL